MSWWVILLIVIAVIIVLFVAGFIVFTFKKKQTKSLVSDSFIDALTLYLGGLHNILQIEVEQSRLKITVNELDLVDLEKLKTLSDKGIFVTGNTIKALYKDDAKNIKDALEKRLKNA